MAVETEARAILAMSKEQRETLTIVPMLRSLGLERFVEQVDRLRRTDVVLLQDLPRLDA